MKYSRIHGSVKDGQVDLNLEGKRIGAGSSVMKYSRIKGKF
jgi:hypothetical protein